jgi:hypothetical protein
MPHSSGSDEQIFGEEQQVPRALIAKVWTLRGEIARDGYHRRLDCEPAPPSRSPQSRFGSDEQMFGASNKSRTGGKASKPQRTLRARNFFVPS